MDTEAGFPFGGNVIHLPDHRMFICMGSDYPKRLIVNREQKILWVHYLKWMVVKKICRANITTCKDLERLIWNAEKKTGCSV